MPLFLVRSRATKNVFGTITAPDEKELWNRADSEFDPLSKEYARLDLVGERGYQIRQAYNWFTFKSYTPDSYGFGVSDKASNKDYQQFRRDRLEFGAFPSANPKNPRNGLLKD